jgi:hypothetical protein
MRRTTQKKITKTLRFTEIYDRNGRFVGGGVDTETHHIENETWVQADTDPVYDPVTDSEGPTGQIQLHIGGTRRAFAELGTFLLGMAHYRPPKGRYDLHVRLTNVQQKPALHLIVHLPVDDPAEREPFLQTHTGGEAILYADGTLIDVTPKAIHPKDQPASGK